MLYVYTAWRGAFGDPFALALIQKWYERQFSLALLPVNYGEIAHCSAPFP